jgi:hypothetical protein
VQYHGLKIFMRKNSFCKLIHLVLDSQEKYKTNFSRWRQTNFTLIYLKVICIMYTYI